MRKNPNERTCRNCRYYSQHYSKIGIRYGAVGCGHCFNQNNKKMRPIENCELWENIAIAKQERKRLITETVEFMAERLDEMVILLKDDNKN